MLVCRTCLARKNLSPLFGELGAEEFDDKQLFKATGLEMQKNDGFPQQACNSCIKHIREFIHFQELCAKAHEILRSILPTVKTETIHIKSIYEDIIYGTDNPLFIDVEISNEEQNISNSNSDINVKIEVEQVDDDDIPISNLREEKSIAEIPEEPKTIKHRDKVKKNRKKIQKRITIEDLESSDSGTDKGMDFDVEMPELTASWTGGAPTNEVPTLSSLFTMNQNGFERQKTLNEFKERNEFYMSLAVNPHNKAIHRKAPIECNKCHKVLSDKASFLTHARTHFEPEFACDICDKKFHSRYHMGYHQQRRHGRVKRLACTQCGFRAVDRTTLLNHVRLEHTGERPYICDECGVSFRMRRAIAQHMRTHFGVKNHQCDRCPGMYKSLSQLWSHQHRVHLMTYTYPCYLCSDTYRSREAVKKHLLNVHGLPNDQQLKVECVKIKK